jgi:peptidoglycan hydrolase CwlO-like protein
MKLKLMAALIMLLSAVGAAAQTATRGDIQALDARISNLETKVDEMDKRLTNQIEELDKRLTNRIEEMDKRLTNRIEELDKRLTARIDMLFWAIGALIGVVLAVIALPQLLEFFQSRRDRVELMDRVNALEYRVKTSEQEIVVHQRAIEELKSRRIVTPS